MNNNAKIYTLYFALSNLITSICDMEDERGHSEDTAAYNDLFAQLIGKGIKKYISLTHETSEESKVDQEISILYVRTNIETHLGRLNDNDNLDLIFSLWFAFLFGLKKYFCMFSLDNKPNLLEEKKYRLKLGYNQYLVSKTLSRDSCKKVQDKPQNPYIDLVLGL